MVTPDFCRPKQICQRTVAVEMESLTVRLNKYVNLSMTKNFHEFLRPSTNIISNNIYS